LAHRLLIHGGLVVPRAGARPQPRADILIEDGRIAAVGRLPGAGSRVDRVIDAADRIVFPGLVNAHCHTYETFNRGVAPMAPMEIWALYGHPVLGVTPRTPDEVYWRTLLPCLEMLRNGVTTVIDDISVYYDHRDEIVDAIMQAYRDAGIRAWASVKAMDRPLYETLPIETSRIPADLLRAFKRVCVPTARQLLDWSRRNIRRQERQGGLAHFVPNPSAPQRCTMPLLQGLHRMAEEQGFPFVIHVQETRLQVLQGRQRYGHSMLAELDARGLLTDVTSIMHGVWLDGDDMRRVADRGSTVVHNPASNCKLGSGLAPLRALLEAGVNVALGCDGTSSNDGVSLLEAMKWATLLTGLTDPDYRRWLTPHEAFGMATEGGARSALWERQIGAIEPGRRADLVLYDRRAPAFAPLRDPIAQLVLAEAGQSIRTVLVDGRVVMDAGRVLTADIGHAAERVQEIGRRLAREQARTFGIARRLEPLWRAMVAHGHHEPLPIDRLAWSASRRERGRERTRS
jgi:cytosine/adenosine deaminase-related metal-dependent hydrolase